MTTNNNQPDEGAWGHEINIDFGSVDDSSTIPKGKYTARVVFAQPGFAKTSKEPKIDIRWAIDDGPMMNRQIIDNVSFHPNRLPQTKRVLKAMGFDASGQVSMQLGEIADSLLGAVAVIDVDIEPAKTDPSTGTSYEARNRVKSVRPYRDAAGVIAESEEESSF